MVIATFFIQEKFYDSEQRAEFGAAMLDRNCYLFRDNEGNNNKVS